MREEGWSGRESSVAKIARLQPIAENQALQPTSISTLAVAIRQPRQKALAEISGSHHRSRDGAVADRSGAVAN